MFLGKKKDNKNKKNISFNLFKNKKTTSLTIVLAIVLSLGIISFVTKTNVITYVAERILKELGIYTSEVRNIEIESSDYASEVGGSWHIDKTAIWTSKSTAKVTFHLNSIPKQMGNYKDIIIVFDKSSTMGLKKLGAAKDAVAQFINYVLSNSNNRVALITYDDSSNVMSGFTNDKDLLGQYIKSLDRGGFPNYNAALQNVDAVMDGYVKEDNRDVVTVFLAGWYPDENTSNQIGTYELLKDKYPYMGISGIQYDIGTVIIENFKTITDFQFIADRYNIASVLNEAALLPEVYETFQIVDYIDNDYFYVDSVNDIKVSKGQITLEEENGIQKIIWKFRDRSLLTGESAYMNIDLKLKDEYINNMGYYPTNRKEIINYNLPKEEEKVVSSNKTPVLKNSYDVIYDSNAPAGCTGINETTKEEHFVYENVTKKSDELTCDGWLFLGWEMSDEVTKVNDDVFVMPQKDVIIRGTWARPSISKSTYGSIHESTNLYRIVKADAENNKGAMLYTGNGSDKFANKVYYYNGDAATTNNNVIFGGFCWKMVRTTETGGVKLIYNGTPNEYFETRGLEKSEYINVMNDENYPFEFDSTSKKWVNNYRSRMDNVTITFSVPVPGDYIIKNNAASQEYCGHAVLRIYKDGDEIGTYWGEENDNLMLKNIDATYSIKVSYTNYCTDIGDIPTFEFSFEVREDASSTKLICSRNSDFDIGRSSFNEKADSPAYVGYMYNSMSASTYPLKEKNRHYIDIVDFSWVDENEKYYYGDSIVYDGSNYTLKNNNGSALLQKTFFNDYKWIKEKYRCSDGTQTTCSEVYYIASADKYGRQYSVAIKDGQKPEDLVKMTLGKSISKNDNGTYTINDPVTITKSDWYANKYNYRDYYICSNYISVTCEDIFVITNTDNPYGFAYLSPKKNTYTYGSTFTYKDGKYELSNTKQIWDPKDYGEISTRHYACFDNDCAQLSYVYSQKSDGSILYIDLPVGKTVEDALNEMLWNDDVNKDDSTIKSMIDSWYAANLSDYTDRLEDTVFCSDRTITSLGSWNPNGGRLEDNLTFGFYGRKSSKNYDLTCANKNDRFTVSASNGNGKLTYPVGLISGDEAGLSDNNIKVSNRVWYGSPYSFDSILGASGIANYFDEYVSMDEYVRPSVSLKPGTEYVSGDGSSKNPYIVQ